MEDLTFGEQVKIVLGRKGMTIKELAEKIERETGKKMSRQNLTQRLGRDNFQEQDMRLIASILECPFQLSIMSGEMSEIAPARVRKPEVKVKVQEQPVETKKEEAPVVEKNAETVDPSVERDMTIGELYDIHEELSELEKNAKAGEPVEEIKEELQQAEEEYKEEDAPEVAEAVQTEPEADETEEVQAEDVRAESPEYNSEYNYSPSGQSEDYTETYAQQTAGAAYGDAYEEPETEASYTSDYVQAEPENYAEYEEPEEEPVEEPVEEPEEEVGDINPYTGREYESNSVRMHPSRIGYVQVYDRSIHKWTDMTEWAFLGYQERKKVLLGKAYEPPIYLD